MSYHFSLRTGWEMGDNPLSLAMTELKARGESWIDLTESNPTRCGFNYPPEIFLSPLASHDSLTYSPHSQGLPAAREAVAKYYAGKNIPADPSRMILTSSTSEAYSFLFRLLFEPGDRVLIPAPSYPLFSYLAGLNDVEVDTYRLIFKDGAWRMDFSSVESAAGSFTRAIVLVSPNNPTGSCLKTDELEKLNEICRRKSLSIICDEVFADYLFDKDPALCESLAGNADVPTFVLSGLSKALALPQMKMSWILANGPADFLSECMPRLEVIADTFLSVNTPVQHACGVWLENGAVIREQILNRVKSNYAVLKDMLPPTVKLFPTEGGWYAVLHAQGIEDAETFALELLESRKVFVHPGYFFDFEEEGFLVVSLLPEAGKFRDAAGRLADALAKISKV